MGLNRPDDPRDHDFVLQKTLLLKTVNALPEQAAYMSRLPVECAAVGLNLKELYEKMNTTLEPFLQRFSAEITITPAQMVYLTEAGRSWLEDIFERNQLNFADDAKEVHNLEREAWARLRHKCIERQQLLEPAELVVCPLCTRVLNRPRITNCGHMFCKKCIHRHARHEQHPGWLFVVANRQTGYVPAWVLEC